MRFVRIVVGLIYRSFYIRIFCFNVSIVLHSGWLDGLIALSLHRFIPCRVVLFELRLAVVILPGSSLIGLKGKNTCTNTLISLKMVRQVVILVCVQSPSLIKAFLAQVQH